MKRNSLRFRKIDLENWLEEDKRKAILADNILKKALTNPPSLAIDKAKGGSCSLARKKGQTCFNYGYGSIYFRETKEKNLRWYVDFRDENGKRIRKVVKDAFTKEQALVALKDEVLKTFAKKRGISFKREKIGFSDFSKSYLQDYMMTARRNWKSDLYRLKKLNDYFADIELAKVTPMMIEKFRAKRLKAGSSKSTTNRYLALLKRLFSVAIEEGYAEANPVKRVKFFSERDTFKDQVLTKDEEERLVNECSERLRPVVLTALNTGMRKSEILGLRWSCVDLTRREIKVEKAKSGKVRFIPVNDVVFQEFKRLRKESRDGEFVFPYRSVRTAFENARKRAGLRVRFHDLRHTFATRLIEKGVDIVTVQDLLGHSTVIITQRYTHAADERKWMAVEILAQKSEEIAKKKTIWTHLRHMEKDSRSRKLPAALFSEN